MCLEGRVVLSSYAHGAEAAHALVSQTAPTPPILASFPLEAPGLASGNPVYERRTIKFFDGFTQTNDQTYTLSGQIVTVTNHITLPGAMGTESAVDHFTAIPGGVLFQDTLTEPNGQTLTETRTDTFDTSTHEILRSGSIQRFDGVTITFTSSTVRHGNRTVVNGSFHESNGISYTTHEVDISHGQGIFSATVTTKWPDGSHQVNKSTGSVVLLAGPQG
jgi:hypothetical protein